MGKFEAGESDEDLRQSEPGIAANGSIRISWLPILWHRRTIAE